MADEHPKSKQSATTGDDSVIVQVGGDVHGDINVNTPQKEAKSGLIKPNMEDILEYDGQTDELIKKIRLNFTAGLTVKYYRSYEKVYQTNVKKYGWADYLLDRFDIRIELENVINRVRAGNSAPYLMEDRRLKDINRVHKKTW